MKEIDAAIEALESIHPGNMTPMAEENWNAALAGLRSLTVKQGEQDSVATLWQHGETGRTRVVMPNSVMDCDAQWQLVGPLYLHPAPEAKQEPVAWGTEVKYGKLFFHIGVQSFAIDYTPEDEPDFSAGDAMAWMEQRLREALSKLAHPAPVNQQLLEALKQANSNHEEFERKWYLACDLNEQLLAALKDLLHQAKFSEDEGGWDFEQARAAIAQAEKGMK